VDVFGSPARSARGRALRLLAVAVPLVVCVAVLSWRGVADPWGGIALGGLGFGLLALRRWVR